jgi:tetratricopeptide (TPR) repeat protein
VITVHGIRTFGLWQERLENLLKQREQNIEVYNYKFGYFSVIGFMIPFLRWLVTLKFRRELLQIWESANDARIDIVAHSFGTHLVAWGLYRVPKERRPRIHTVILAGSVLKSGFRWGELTPEYIKRVVNDCGARDWVLICNQLFVLFTGMAGRVGFYGLTSESFRNRFFSFSHSGYFADSDGQKDSFMSEYWVPLLTLEGHSGPVPIVDTRKTTRLQETTIFLLNNAEPIKLLIYIAPLLILIFYLNNLNVRAEKARQAAVMAAEHEAQARADAEASALEAKDARGVALLRLEEARAATEKEKAALALAEARRQDAERQARIAEQRRQEAEQIAAEARHTLKQYSNLLIQSNSLKEAEGDLNKSLAVYESRNDLESVSMILSTLAGVYQQQGKHQLALASYERALEIYRRIKDRKGEAATLNGMGEHYSLKRDYKTALSYFKKAVRIYEELNEKEPLAGALRNIGQLSFDKGRFDEGISFYQQAIDIQKQAGNPRTLAAWLAQIATGYMRINKSVQAIPYLEKSVEMYRQSGSKKELESSLRYLVSAYNTSKDYPNIIKTSEQLLLLYREQGNVAAEADELYYMASIFEIKGDQEKAIEYYNHALKAYDFRNNKPKMHQTYSELGSLYMKLKQYRAALDFFQKSFDMFPKAAAKSKATLLKKMSDAYAALGNADKAKDMLEQSETLMASLIKPDSADVSTGPDICDLRLEEAQLTCGERGLLSFFCDPSTGASSFTCR